MGEVLFVDLNLVPKHFNDALRQIGVIWSKWEPQPMADQIKIHGCTNVPEKLPDWLRRSS